jgi:hypothetical protein
MVTMIVDALAQAWSNFLAGVAAFVPRLVVMLTLAVAGWIMAALLRFVTRWLLRLLRFNRLAERAGGSELLRRAELPPADVLLASLIFWLVLIGFLLSGLGALGVQGGETLVSQFLRFVPQLLLGLAILAAGVLGANFAWRATLLAAVNAKMPSARLVAEAVRLLILLLAVAMALEQIGVAQAVVLRAFTIAFGAVMLGAAIAFGIGGGPIARRILERRFPAGDPPAPSGDVGHL